MPIAVFLILGCVLEGLPAILLLAPIMFPITKKLGIHDIHYSMVVVTAMNIGLMMPPIEIVVGDVSSATLPNFAKTSNIRT
jgi:TRAP-type C4-dicarboxylate transport system permease large subunit